MTTAVQETKLSVRPRVEPPPYVYRGLGDEHLRGQPCYCLETADDEHVVVVMSCGCQAIVPWWTLEPRTG
jgi:hypothetical protein